MGVESSANGVDGQQWPSTPFELPDRPEIPVTSKIQPIPALRQPPPGAHNMYIGVTGITITSHGTPTGPVGVVQIRFRMHLARRQQVETDNAGMMPALDVMDLSPDEHLIEVPVHVFTPAAQAEAWDMITMKQAEAWVNHLFSSAKTLPPIPKSKGELALGAIAAEIRKRMTPKPR